jgi:hypothetical protein
MEWLKILIFNYPSVKRPNKKPRIPNFTQTRLLSSSSSSSSLLNSFSPPPCSGMYSSPLLFFLLSFFLISILYEFVFFSLLNFTCNYIKVKKNISSFFVFFSLYLFFILFLIFFVLNNCMNVVVGFVFIWDQLKLIYL